MTWFHRVSTCVLALSLTLGGAAPSQAIARVHAPEAEQPEPAPADVDAEADALIEDARARFDAGDFEGAIVSFERAHALRPNPNLIYNIGRVQEEAGRIELALEQYRRFVREPGVDLSLREKAVERIDVLRRIIEATRPAATPDPVVVPPTEPVPTQTPSTVPPPRDDGRSLRLGGGIVAGIGAATLVAGAIVGGLASRDASTLEDTGDPDERRDLVFRGRREALSADILFGVGAGIALAGFITAMTGVERGRAARRARVTADVRPGHVAGAITIRF